MKLPGFFWPFHPRNVLTPLFQSDKLSNVPSRAVQTFNVRPLKPVETFKLEPGVRRTHIGAHIATASNFQLRFRSSCNSQTPRSRACFQSGNFHKLHRFILQAFQTFKLPKLFLQLIRAKSWNVPTRDTYRKLSVIALPCCSAAKDCNDAKALAECISQHLAHLGQNMRGRSQFAVRPGIVATPLPS